MEDVSAIKIPEYSSAREQIEAFNRRKQEDLQRQKIYPQVERRQRFHKRLESLIDSDSDSAETTSSADGEEGWRNSEGERLGDFGVDEEVEFYDEEDIPLAVLIERRRNKLKE